jgi:CheY-like chemotaxis protein
VEEDKVPQHALVVDDDLDTCKVIQAILRSADIEALISVDSVHAVELLSKQKFDAIFLDVNMPHPDGIEITRLTRKSGYNQKTPVIIVTGEEDPSVLGRGFQAGANFFLFKPINKESLLNLARATHGAVQREKRHYQRVVVSCKVQVSLDRDVVEGETIDASLNGLLIRADRTFAVGSNVSIRLFPSPGTRPIAAAGVIVRLAGQHMGIRLENVDKDSRKRLQEFLLPLILGMTQC